MPEISVFYGIRVTMNFKDHAPPHIHAAYGEYEALYNIKDLLLIKGNLPNKAQFLVLEWMEQYQQELLRMWEDESIHRLPPLV